MPATASPRLDYHFIDGATALERLCRRLRAAPAVAIDTEFERSRTFYTRPALVTLADQSGQYLIDPLAGFELAPLLELLGDERVPKVLHSATEDLEVFEQLGGALAGPLFDLQMAAAFAGYGPSVGYRRLVEALFGVDLPKTETRSNWLRRPLSEAQVRYAALDVAYLLPAHGRLEGELAGKPHRQWLEEDCARLLERHRAEPDHAEAYRRIAGAWRLDRRGLAVLRALAAWREQEARRRDRPRMHIARDELLLELARQRPRSPETSRALLGRALARDAETLLRLIDRVASLPDDALPAPLAAPADLRPYQAELKDLQGIVERRAWELELPPPLLATRRTLEALLRRVRIAGTAELPGALRGWREEAIGKPLLACLTGDNA